MTSPTVPARLARLPDFVRLWTSNLLGDVGAAFATLALSVTAVVVLHASAIEVAVIAALGNGAYLVLGAPVGVWADRMPAKRLLVTADLARFATVATVPIAYAFHALTVPQLMLVAAITSAANVVYEVAHTTALPPIVGTERVAQADAALQAADSTVSVVGPGLAGQLIAVTSGPIAYLVTAAMHLGSSIAAGLIAPNRAVAASDHPPFWPSLKTGLAFVFRTQLQRTFVLSAATINFGAGIISATYSLFVLRALHFTAAEYGLVLSIGAVGGILASLIAIRVRGWLGEIRTQLICYALIPLVFAPAPLAPLIPIPTPVSVTVAEFLINLVIVTATICSAGVYPRITPPELFGRATAARRTITMGVLPLGALIGGGLASAFGYAATLWIAVGVIACSVLVFATSPIIRMRDLPKEWEHAPS